MSSQERLKSGWSKQERKIEVWKECEFRLNLKEAASA